MPGNAREKFYPRDQAEGLRQEAKKFPPAGQIAKENVSLRPSPEEGKIKERITKEEQALNQSLSKN